MITRLTGALESLDGSTAVLALPNSGIAYEVLLPAYLAARLRAAHALDVAATGVALASLDVTVTFHILEYLESQGQGTSFIPRLLGFGSPSERDFFDLLTSVKGLGNKRALRALAMEPGHVADAIVSRDLRRLQELPEIGKKLAETIVLELRDKAKPFVQLPAGAASSPGAHASPLDAPHSHLPPAAAEAVNAIMNLGESEAVAERMVTRALRADPKLTSTDQIISAAYAAGGA